MAEVKKQEYKTYLGRYYVLTAISLLSAQQNLSWASFSPIAKEAWDSYGLSSIEVTLLPGTYTSTCIYGVPFVSKLKI